ncbi:hypothetical protein N1851_013931 [Merluccius polli]|uniref:Uncharacterized protein n=1 Tax=Merluccius polli TaxID=89951 RepID=A0AA47MV96_MERPO|nr:hypothetical protein N1851_013931 [Merluccius polli]
MQLRWLKILRPDPVGRSRREKRRWNNHHRGQQERQDDHPFLELQQTGFNMLERELGGIQQSVRWVNTPLSRMEMLLRPLGHIADSLGRLDEAVEHLVAATPPPPPSTRSIRSTLRSAAPGPSSGQSCGAPYVSLVDSCSFRGLLFFSVMK